MSDYSIQLLDAAKQRTGSDYKTAKALGIQGQQLSTWRNKRAAIPVADVVLLAEIAGLKPEEWAARAIVQKYEGTPKGDALYRALGKALAATGAVLVSSGANAQGICSDAIYCFIRCIDLLSRRPINARVKRYAFYST